MGISVAWDNTDRTILRMVCEGYWTLEEFYDANRQLISAMNSTPHQVHVILDTMHSRAVPKGFMTALRGLRLNSTYPNMGLMISIGNNAFVRAFVNLFLKIHPKKAADFLMAGSEEEAYEILSRADQSVV